MDIRQVTLAEWDDALPEAGFEVFHTPEALNAIAAHATGDLRLYAGYKGEQVVGLFPAVVRESAVGTAVFSPPPGLSVPRLGPLVTPTSPKRRKREKVNLAFTEGVLERLRVDDPLTLFRAVCPTAYPDPRPYVWSSLDLDTSFTYHLDVGDDADALLRSFSKSLRREIRDGADLDVRVETSDEADGARTVLEQTRERYAEQDRTLPLEWPYVRDLTAGLADVGRCRTYLVRNPAGDVLSGVVVLYSNDVAYYWLGGTRETYEGTSVNSLLHWRIVEDHVDGDPIPSVSAYDLMGANVPRLCRYKSKFGAELVPYYAIETAGAGMRAAKAAFRLVKR